MILDLVFLLCDSFYQFCCLFPVSASLLFCLFTFFSFSLLTKLRCSTCISLIYFPSKMVFGCQPACTFCEGDKCCFCMQCCCFLIQSQAESIFSQHFFQLIWTEMFLPHISFRKWLWASSACGIQLDFTMGSGFSVQTCTNLICWPLCLPSSFSKKHNTFKSFQSLVVWSVVEYIQTNSNVYNQIIL